jgi:transposase-like protein
MLKDSETPTYAQRRPHRVYTPEFKANLVAACHKPGASIAALANANAMNANVLHRWLQEHARTGAHQLSSRSTGKNTATPGTQALIAQRPAFIALPLGPAASQAQSAPTQATSIRVEIQRSSTTIIVNWPVQDSAACAQWLRECLQ